MLMMMMKMMTMKMTQMMATLTNINCLTVNLKPRVNQHQPKIKVLKNRDQNGPNQSEYCINYQNIKVFVVFFLFEIIEL